ncbi:MAG TPA: hypothetical protein PKA58_21205, partial [Polyangium sp.]|nr:hypothetical protein [Polyangium sp.]
DLDLVLTKRRLARATRNKTQVVQRSVLRYAEGREYIDTTLRARLEERPRRSRAAPARATYGQLGKRGHGVSIPGQTPTCSLGATTGPRRFRRA